MSRLRQHFLTGLLSVTPLAITGWILWRFYVAVDGSVRPLLERITFIQDNVPPFAVTVSGVVVSVLALALVGVFTRNLIGIAFFNLVERLPVRIPIIKGIFSATKQIAEVFLQDRRTAFQQVVLFEYPRRGAWSIGFVTHDDPHRDLVHVFLPTTPNPTSGFMLVLPRADVKVLPLTVEEGIRLIISGGAVLPGRHVDDFDALVDPARARAGAVDEGR